MAYLQLPPVKNTLYVLPSHPFAAASNHCEIEQVGHLRRYVIRRVGLSRGEIRCASPLQRSLSPC